MTTKRDRAALRTPATINPIARQNVRHLVADLIKAPDAGRSLENYAAAHLGLQGPRTHLAAPTVGAVNAELAALRDEFPDLFASSQAGDAAVRRAL